MYTVTIPAEYSTCTWMYIFFKRFFPSFGFRRKPDQKVSYCVFMPSWLMMYHCKIDTRTEMTLQFDSFQYERVKMSKSNNFMNLEGSKPPCIKMICVGLIFKYGVSCRFHETPTVNVFVRNLIDDVIAIKKTALPPHIPRID